MASTRDIKRRRDSIQSTEQITKAMKLVATVKLQRAKHNAEKSRSYFNCMFETVQSLLGKTQNLTHKYLVPGDSPRKAVVVITSNRGLAGGYNSNVIKLITKGDLAAEKDNLDIYPIGKKGRDAFSRLGYTIKAGEKIELDSIIEEPLYIDAKQVCDELLERYAAGEIGEIYLAYTAFKNTVSHIPTLLKLLPVEQGDSPLEEMEGSMEGSNASASDERKDNKADVTPMNFEPAAEDALDMLIPKYVSSILYGALVAAVASENGARMQAMDNATSNADEMIEHLSLLYNRARQSHITQELTEIIAGAEAIS